MGRVTCSIHFVHIRIVQKTLQGPITESGTGNEYLYNLCKFLESYYPPNKQERALKLSFSLIVTNHMHSPVTRDR